VNPSAYGLETGMDIEDLRVLIAVAKNGSMNRAATDLNTVQSNVTSKIRAMEEELGVPLFFRKSRGVEPSEAGLRLLAYSEKITALFEEAIRAVKEDGVPKGRLCIGTTVSTVLSLLPTIVSQYTDRFQEVDLRVSNEPTNTLVEAVLEGRIDGAFVAGPIDRHELDEALVLTEELVLVSSPSLPTLDSFHKASNLKLIGFYSECSYRQRLDQVLKGMNLKYKVVEFDSLQSLISCFVENTGVTLLPEAVMRELMAHENVVVHRLPKETAMSEIVFVQRRDHRPSAALNAFLLITRDVCNSSFPR
jgi:DNA-binding transcriptional LysR family regulator